MSYEHYAHGRLSTLLGIAAVTIFGILSILASGGGGGGGDTPTTTDVTGFWSGSWSSSIVNQGGTLSAQLVQTGTSLTGTFSIDGSPCISSGDIDGTISGLSIDFVVTSGIDDVHISGTLNGSTIVGTYSISIGLCAGDQGTFSLSLATPAIVLGHGIRYTTNGIRVGKTAIGDLNGDGLADAVTMEAGGFGQRLLIYYQNGSGAFSAPVVHTLPDTYIRSITLGDVNDDAATDLVVSGLSISALSGYMGRIMVVYQDPVSGVLGFPGAEHVVSSTLVGSLVVADLNADARQDIAVLGSWEQTPGMGNIAVFYQNILGGLDMEQLYDSTPVDFTGELQAADMDHDGDMDLILKSGPLELAIIRQDGSQTPPVLSPTPEFHTIQTSYWSSFDAFAVADLNGDGRNDVAVLDPGNNGNLNLLYQNPQGSLDGPALTPQPSSPPYGLEAADIDRDGMNELLGDLVTPTFDANSGGIIYVFEPDSTPPFGDSVEYSFGTVSGGGSAIHDALSLGDVTGDGYLDAVVTWADEGLYVLPARLQ